MNTTPLIALCVGHSRKIDGRTEGGAVSINGTQEWIYNCGLAELIAKNLAAIGDCRSVIISEYEGTGYGAAQRWLASHLKGLNAACALELHFNAADDPSAHGHEWLHWHSSRRGRDLAVEIDHEICITIPELRHRGVKPIVPGDRGAEFLKLTHCPAVICEPFFGTNAADWQIATSQRDRIARAIAEAIVTIF